MRLLKALPLWLALAASVHCAAVVVGKPLASDDRPATAGDQLAGKVIVNVDNYVRVETAAQIDRFLKLTQGMNKWHHNRQPTPLDKQNVIRMNRDTLYSFAVVDISKGATLTLPDSGDRYRSVMVVNEDEYINEVFHEGGVYELTVEKFDTPYVVLVGRTLADPTDPADIEAANALQDGMEISAASEKPYSHPSYDQASYEATYKPLLELSKGVSDTKHMFGKRDEVRETRHMLGAAFGWGGLPIYEAYYVTRNQPRDAGAFELTVKDVPVDGFWSISVYDKDGFFQENPFDSYSINNLTAKPNEDGSITVNFGEEQGGKDNFLYVMDGWNYAVRLYRPRKEILDGRWVFPEPEPAQ